MEDFLEISEEILSIPIRIGVAKDITSSFKNINRNNFLTSIGLVKYGLMKKNKKIEMVNLTFIEKVKYQLKRIVDEYF